MSTETAIMHRFGMEYLRPVIKNKNKRRKAVRAAMQGEQESNMYDKMYSFYKQNPRRIDV